MLGVRICLQSGLDTSSLEAEGWDREHGHLVQTIQTASSLKSLVRF